MLSAFVRLHRIHAANWYILNASSALSGTQLTLHFDDALGTDRLRPMASVLYWYTLGGGDVQCNGAAVSCVFPFNFAERIRCCNSSIITHLIRGNKRYLRLLEQIKLASVE